MTEAGDSLRTQVTAQDRYLWKVGGLLAIVGGVVYMIANLVHPRSPDIEVYEEQIRAVAASDAWTVGHLLWLLGALLIILGLYALGRSVSSEKASIWARFGTVTAVVSGSLAAVMMGIDGIQTDSQNNGFLPAKSRQFVPET